LRRTSTINSKIAELANKKDLYGSYYLDLFGINTLV